MNKHVPVVVFTGGPCAGKSTLIWWMRQKLGDMGWHVVVVGEAATEFILAGLGPSEQGLGIHFQRELIEHVIAKEERYKKAAANIPGKVVVLCDRGVPDSIPYMTSAEFTATIGLMGYSLVSVRDERYDGVVFLHSVAYDKPELYTQANNAARRETVDEAKVQNERTLAAWMGHPHVRVINNSTDMEGKSRRALAEICRILSIPAPLEIERKFLISSFDPAQLPIPNQQVDIQQFYLESSVPGLHERVRARSQGGGVVYYHTTKRTVGPGVRVEEERQIHRAEYCELLLRADKRFAPVIKTRTCFVYLEQYFELDVFRNPRGLILLEHELTEVNTATDLPPFLAPFATDVTGDPYYDNSEIAKRLAA